MIREALLLVPYFWILLAFVQQIIGEGISILWLFLFASFALYHRKYIPQYSYKFRYVLFIIIAGSIGWFLEPDIRDKRLFYQEFWWIQLTLGYLSALFLIQQKNQRSLYWSAAMSACCLFFSFYLYSFSFSDILMLLAWIGFLWLAFPRSSKAYPHWKTISLWLTLFTITAGSALLWKSLYPQYRSWAHQQWYQKQNVQKGFSWDMKLGGMSSIWNTQKDNEVILRLWGPKSPSYMRGASYQKYYKGEWFPPRKRLTIHPTKTDLEHQVYQWDIQQEWHSQYKVHSQDINTIFHPLETKDFAIPEDSLHINETGQWGSFTPKKHPYYFNTQPSSILFPPSEHDLQIPESLQIVLQDIAYPFQANTPVQTSFRIAHFFQTQFTYTLTPPNTPQQIDPTLFFLTESQQGYCEYFASASVLLLRSLDIPARLAKGYAFPEKGPAKGQWIFRRKSAHAWVEFWNGNSWVTFDPTPSGALPQQKAISSWARRFETLQFHYIELKDWLFYGDWRIEADLWKQKVEQYITHISISAIFCLLLFFFYRKYKKRASSSWGKNIQRIEKKLAPYTSPRPPWMSVEEWSNSIPWNEIYHKQKNIWRKTLENFCLTRYSR